MAKSLKARELVVCGSIIHMISRGGDVEQRGVHFLGIEESCYQPCDGQQGFINSKDCIVDGRKSRSTSGHYGEGVSTSR